MRRPLPVIPVTETVQKGTEKLHFQSHRILVGRRSRPIGSGCWERPRRRIRSARPGHNGLGESLWVSLWTIKDSVDSVHAHAGPATRRALSARGSESSDGGKGTEASTVPIALLVGSAAGKPRPPIGRSPLFPEHSNLCLSVVSNAPSAEPAIGPRPGCVPFRFSSRVRSRF